MQFLLLFLPQCFVGEIFSTSTLCHQNEKGKYFKEEWVHPQTGVPCYFLNIINLLKEIPQAGLKHIKTSTGKGWDEIFNPAFSDALKAAEKNFMPETHLHIPTNEISDKQQLKKREDIPALYLWNLLIAYLEKHKPLLPEKLVVGMMQMINIKSDESKNDIFLNFLIKAWRDFS